MEVLDLASAERPTSPEAVAWADLLGRWGWTWFSTCTWRPPPRPAVPERWSFETRSSAGPEQRLKAWRSHVWRCEQEVLDLAGVPRPKRRSRAPLAWWVRADEPHKSGAWHCHGLVRWPTWAETALGAVAVREPSRWEAIQRWAEDHGWQRIAPPLSGAAVAAYCAKYCAKDAGQGRGELELGGREPRPVQLGIWSPQRPPQGPRAPQGRRGPRAGA